MRVVYDTNVVVSGMLFGGLPLRTLEVIRAQKATLIASEEMISELHVVLSRDKFRFRIANINHTVESLLDLYSALVELVEPAEVGRIIKDDPKDDKFIACAIGGKANLIVSGDHHLLDLGHYEDIEIIGITPYLLRFESSE